MENSENNRCHWSVFLPSLKEKALNEAVGSVFFKNQALNRWLRETLGGTEGKDLSQRLLGDPVFEATFAWKSSSKTFRKLGEEGLFSREALAAFGDKYATVHPYRHQLEAFSLLLERERHNSVILSSGTGSGKTECFMMPLIEDLARECRGSSQKRQGVRALFLYPLNALIESQKQRLRAWTQPFEGRFKFCLYNGDLIEKDRPRGAALKSSEEVISRQEMREEYVPDMLLTNPSMLERMLLRQSDRPILEKTRRARCFRWVIIDEAHTYIGTKAADLALLIRRVLNAFGVSPNDVHFVATSATVDASDEEAKAALRRFLIDLSGADESRVHLILGARKIPSATSVPEGEDAPLDEIRRATDDGPDGLWARLMNSPTAVRIRNAFITTPGHALRLSALQRITDIRDEETLLGWIDLLTSSKHSDLPLRLHQMFNTTGALRVCPDPNCPEKTGALKHPEWRFGSVWFDGREKCGCGAPLFPLAACPKCNDVALKADVLENPYTLETVIEPPSDEREASRFWSLFEESGNTDIVRNLEEAAQEDEDDENEKASAEGDDAPDESSEPKTLSEGENEEEFDEEPGEEEDDPSQWFRLAGLITNREEDRPHCLTWKVFPDGGFNEGDEGVLRSADIFVRVSQSLEKEDRSVFTRGSDRAIRCPSCSEWIAPERFYIRSITQRYVNGLIPLVLEFGGADDTDVDAGKPMFGRKLLSFTDSRQGTAKNGALIEREGEKSLVVTTLMEELLKAAKQKPSLPPESIPQFQTLLATLPADSPQYATILAMLQESGQGVTWTEMQTALERIVSDDRGEYRHLMAGLWPSLPSEKELTRDERARQSAEILLLREFGARPVNGMSLETCGLVRLTYKGLKRSEPPVGWPANLTKEDWQRYLKIFIDFYLRLNHVIELPRYWLRIGGDRSFFARTVQPPARKEKLRGKNLLAWPQVHREREMKKQSRIVRYTAALLGYDIGDLPPVEDAADRMDELLAAVFQTLRNLEILKEEPASHGYRMHLDECVTFERNEKAWVFPDATGLFDTIVGDPARTPCPLEPTLHGAKEMRLPIGYEETDREAHPVTFRRELRTRLAASPEYRALIESGRWNRIGTYALERTGYFAGVEHSAQIDKTQRTRYVEEFEKGYVNVLSSSTTMEMGVDLGGLSSVLLFGVPPHPANYLQRAGRAGRRKELRANALTLCQNRARDKEVFLKPDWALTARQPKLYVSLHSEVIVERHVNAELLCAYLLMTVAENVDKVRLADWLLPVKSEEGEEETTDPFTGSLGRSFIAWLETLALGSGAEESGLLSESLRRVIRYSVLEKSSVADLARRALETIRPIQAMWETTLTNGRKQIEEIRARREKAASLSEEDADEKKHVSSEERSLTYQLDEFKGRELYEALTEELFLPSTIRVVHSIHFQCERKEREESDSSKKKSFRKERKPDQQNPSRDAHVGIFEYAPRASVIIDNGIYESAGIDMDWSAPGAATGLAKIQQIRRVAKCPNCQERFVLGLGETKGVCPSCGAEVPSSRAFTSIFPRGFRVAPGSEPHNDIQRLVRYPVEDSTTFVEGPWRETAVPGVLARSSTTGSLLSTNTNGGRGFGVCLACGWSKPEQKQEFESPDEENKWWHHRPIVPGGPREGPGDLCVGCLPEAGYLRQHGMFLAAESKTDVLELLFLSGSIRGRDTKWAQSTGTGVAVALRRAVAKHYGIDEDEMGFSSSFIFYNGERALKVSLFDRTMGGYSSGVEGNVPELLREAQKYLECPGDCPTACTSCILTFDSQHRTKSLDRHDAMRFLEEILGAAG